MESEIGVDGNEGKLVEIELGKSCCSPSLLKHIADPVVYKLVRLEGDGRLVPATDDEIMKVESFFVGSSEMHIVEDSMQAIGYNSDERFSTENLQHENSEDPLQRKDYEKEPDEGNARIEARVSSLVSTSTESDIIQHGDSKDCLDCPDLLTEGGSSTSVNVTGTAQPDFSILNGKICLDNLSVKDLQDTFRATFGRVTTVKDKMWLKRRITMGLTNSCDVLTTSFIIQDNKLVKPDTEGSSNNNGSTCIKDVITGQPDDNPKDMAVTHGGQVEDHQVVFEKNLRRYRTYDSFGSQNCNTEQSAVKRVRKPTKRYIQELSEVESKDSHRRLTYSKCSAFGQTSPKSHLRPPKPPSDGRSFIASLDSLVGSGTQVPRVYRIRRSRPRKNFMTLWELDPSSMGMTATIAKGALGSHSFHPDNEISSGNIKDHSVSQQFADEQEKDSQLPETIAVPICQDVGLKHMDTSRKSDESMAAVPTSKCGLRRKLHRAWTLSEVMKLVEGVSTYGAGRWSEIKKVAFASYSYRTSVDLKDKWRNLLKASCTQTPTDRGMNSRKSSNGPIPIPSPVLLRVRELARMHQQIPQNIGSSKMEETTENSVQEQQSGFL